ncbi:hypothetical protein OS189_16990 [Sulfitobacter sp. F26169L]|uniref:hypothetical protein n=1 Tax=Sulfitobacter sp. F26169L TaxID=2996015 RepID=UPI002260D37A|nr:hypothetical protein [Sulfitobacter sp. F26169L]MCX7568041.1 hypothetical protein [Sulfitobacter sp. F26169L]
MPTPDPKSADSTGADALHALEQLLQSAHFDPHWYSTTYADVTKSALSPAMHFLKYGAFLARAAAPDFSPHTHADIYEQARASGENPVLLYHRLQAEAPEPAP